MDNKIIDTAGKSIFAILTVYCFLLFLFPIGWVILLGGAMMRPEVVRKVLGSSVPSVKARDKQKK
ncbi:MAG: hypothetical protein PHW56_09445 [Methanosarcinaceae archaeon]|nr:hypothetical protein [Methanosarcinaceae archaeon]